MKPKHHPTRLPQSLREIAALGTLLAAGSAVAADATPKPEEKKDDKKEEGETQQSLGDMLVEVVRQSLYRPEKLASPKYPVPLRDVPQTVNVVPKEVIEEQGAQTLADVMRNVPGITMQAGENGNAAVATGGGFTMRGFDTNNSIFVNGVRDVGYISRDTFNTKSVEAYQGPTGSDVGRGNAGGYVNIATKTPHLGDSYAGSIGFSSGERQRYTADINQQIPTGNNGDFLKGTAVRLNLMYQDGGVPGRDIVERNSFGIAPSLAFGLGTDTRAIFSFQHVVEDNIPDYGLPAIAGRPLPGINREWFYGNVADHEDLRQDAFTARFEHDINENITIRNQTIYIQNSADVNGLSPVYRSPGAAAPKDVVTFSRQANGLKDFTTFSNQTSLSAKFQTGELKHSLVGGVEFTAEGQQVHTYKNSAVPAVPNLPGPFVPNPYDPIAQPPIDRKVIQQGETFTTGLYAFDTVEIGKHWIVSGGLRSDIYDAEYYARNTSGVATGPFNGSDTLYSGKIGLTYKPVEEGSIYLAYSSTQTPPGTAAVSEGAGTTGATGNGTTPGNNNFNSDSQISKNIELGAKWDFFNSALTVSGAVFHTRNENVIYVSDTVPTTVYSYDGAQEVNGVTIGAAGKINENWQILANASYLDATLDQRGATAAAFDGSGQLIPIDGNHLARTPEFSGSLWTTYKLPKGLTVGAGIRYQGKTYTSTNNFVAMAPYAVVDGMVQYDVNEHLNLRLNVYNLLDREYVATSGGGGGGGAGNALVGGHATYGQPISFAFSTNFSF